MPYQPVHPPRLRRGFFGLCPPACGPLGVFVHQRLMHHMARNNWIAVASAQHARRGCATPEHGYMQVCHGKRAPLQRVAPGDRVAYYSPTVTMGGKDTLQKFVSIGLVKEGSPYAFDMGGGFVPFRRDVAYVLSQETPIAPLLDALEFVEDRRRWGYKFRFGLFKVSDADMRLIARSMQADLAHLQLDSLLF